jgi:hypothetical protein
MLFSNVATIETVKQIVYIVCKLAVSIASEESPVF